MLLGNYGDCPKQYTNRHWTNQMLETCSNRKLLRTSYDTRRRGLEIWSRTFRTFSLGTGRQIQEYYLLSRRSHLFVTPPWLRYFIGHWTLVDSSRTAATEPSAYAWKPDDHTCFGSIIHQAYGNSLLETFSNPHYIIIRDAKQQPDIILNNFGVNTYRGNHWNLSAVVRQPAIRISYDIVKLGKERVCAILQGYTGYRAILSADVTIDVNKKHELT